jgi:D-glycerate 3-kinase
MPGPADVSLEAALRRVCPFDPSLVDAYYAPLARDAWRALEARRAQGEVGPLVLGVSGPQGGGKSTLASVLTQALGALGLASVAVSIDDFYLTRAEQLALAARSPDNRYLEHRGYPGTHDVALGAQTLAALTRPTRGEVALPSYDKGAHGGRGDRASAAGRVATTPLDVVIFEGWMLGFEPAERPTRDAHLAEAERALAAYEAWHRVVTRFVLLEARPLELVVRWRVEAEEQRRARGEAGLSSDEARDYVERFLPAYERWVPGLRAKVARQGAHVLLGPDRRPTRITFAP